MADDDLSLANPVPGQSPLGIQDLVNIALPAIVGAGISQRRGQGAGIGALAGIGTGIETQQGLQELQAKRQQQALQMQHQKQLNDEAALQTKKLQQERADMEAQAKDEETFLPSLTPEERLQYRLDRKGFFDDRMLEKSKNANISMIAKSTGQDPKDFEGLDAPTAKELMLKVVPQSMKGQSGKIVSVDASNFDPSIPFGTKSVFASATEDGLKPLTVAEGKNADQIATNPVKGGGAAGGKNAPAAVVKDLQLAANNIDIGDTLLPLLQERSLNLSDKVPQRMWNAANAMFRDQIGVSFNHDINTIGDLFYPLRNAMLKEHYGARITAVERQMIQQEIGDMNIVGMSPEQAYTRLARAMEIYKRGLGRKIHEDEGFGYKVPESMKEQYPYDPEWDTDAGRKALVDEIKGISSATGAKAPAGKLAGPDPSIQSKIDVAKAQGHSPAEIAEYLKTKLQVDPSVYGLGGNAKP